MTRKTPQQQPDNSATGSHGATGTHGSTSTHETFGFGLVQLEPGISRWNMRTYLYSAFWTVGFLAFIGHIQSYLLKEHLGIPGHELGRAVGNLASIGEITLITIAPFFGALSDKYGRRLIYAFGYVWLGIGFFLFPLANSMLTLFMFKAVMGIGVAALGGMMATVMSDYPQNKSRGVLAAMSGWANGLGALVLVVTLSALPSILVSKGLTAEKAGTYTFWAVTALAFFTALIVAVGLKPGKPGKPQYRKKITDLVGEGFRAAKTNPRLRLSFAESFIARGDVLIIGSFLSLWLIHAGTELHGWSIETSTANSRMPIAIAQGSTLLWAPVFGFLLDKFDRVTCVIVAMALATIGYISIGLTPDPSASSATLPLVMLGIGEFSVIMAGQALVAQEAPEDVRGSVLGVFTLCGALGLIVVSQIAGQLFDKVGYGAPFLFVGMVNSLICGYAIYVRRSSGYKPPK